MKSSRALFTVCSCCRVRKIASCTWATWCSMRMEGERAGSRTSSAWSAPFVTAIRERASGEMKASKECGALETDVEEDGRDRGCRVLEVQLRSAPCITAGTLSRAREDEGWEADFVPRWGFPSAARMLKLVPTFIQSR